MTRLHSFFRLRTLLCLLPVLFLLFALLLPRRTQMLRESELTGLGAAPPQTNPYDTLSVPTQIIRWNDTYFLVDCYHDQILFSDSLDRPVSDWLVCTDAIRRGHTIAGDDRVLLADDTEGNRILVLEQIDGSFVNTQTFSDIGIRPHYVVYDQPTARFYALSSMTGELYVFAREKNSSRVYLEKILSIPELNQVYVRSFTLDGDRIYFAAANGTILEARLRDLQVLNRYSVPEEIAGLIQITRIQDYYYLTVSTDLYGNQENATIVRTRDLSDLAAGKYEDIYASFIGGGTPYYLTAFDGFYYLTEHRIPGHSVFRFAVEKNRLTRIETLY